MSNGTKESIRTNCITIHISHLSAHSADLPTALTTWWKSNNSTHWGYVLVFSYWDNNYKYYRHTCLTTQTSTALSAQYCVLTKTSSCHWSVTLVDVKNPTIAANDCQCMELRSTIHSKYIKYCSKLHRSSREHCTWKNLKRAIAGALSSSLGYRVPIIE